ncbi:MAG: aldo/keto reductase [Elusimicrobia bacterium]|nr:aldo/keto reductase [Elusimicrobiota bacterium]
MKTTYPALDVSVTLNDGRRMPQLGLGVYQSEPGPAARQAVKWALEAGYRHIDTAKRYDNESDVGEALRESGLPRESVFVTTKLWNDDQGYEPALKAFEASRKRLGLEYVDLYLLHWPVPGKRLDSWSALRTLQREGRVRSIGVSNFLERHLSELIEDSGVVPAVNQVEFSPFLHQKGLLEFCRSRGIVLESYGPLTQGLRLSHPAVADTAARLGRTPAQVMLRWAVQHGIVVIPKSVRRERIEENSRLFDFSIPPADMRRLDGLDEGLHTEWDPKDVP